MKHVCGLKQVRMLFKETKRHTSSNTYFATSKISILARTYKPWIGNSPISLKR